MFLDKFFGRKKEEKKQIEGLRKWDLLALTFGYNELTKTAQSLGEKVWLRMARDFAEKEYRKLGGELVRTDEEVVVTISEFPKVSFTAKDIELMRKAVEEYDAARTTGTAA